MTSPNCEHRSIDIKEKGERESERGRERERERGGEGEREERVTMSGDSENQTTSRFEAFGI